METKTDAIIVDIDGTLAIVGDRSPYDASNCHLDTVNPQVKMFLQVWYDMFGLPVILMSGRQEKDRQPTQLWLETHGIPFDHLYMRANDDFRNDAIIKHELYETHIKDRYKVFVVLDDRQRVVDMWRQLGLVCWQVNASPD